ncbi:MAG: hypothetical protein Q9228_001096 [Teloschistes exilis]
MPNPVIEEAKKVHRKAKQYGAKAVDGAKKLTDKVTKPFRSGGQEGQQDVQSVTERVLDMHSSKATTGFAWSISDTSSKSTLISDEVTLISDEVILTSDEVTLISNEVTLIQTAWPISIAPGHGKACQISAHIATSVLLPTTPD